MNINLVFLNIHFIRASIWASLVAQSVKNLPTIQETRVQFLGGEDGEGNGNPLQHSCLEKPMDRGAWQATVHGVTKSPMRTEELTLSLSISSILAWEIPWTEEPGGLQRVGHD